MRGPGSMTKQERQNAHRNKAPRVTPSVPPRSCLVYSPYGGGVGFFQNRAHSEGFGRSAFLSCARVAACARSSSCKRASIWLARLVSSSTRRLSLPSAISICVQRWLARASPAACMSARYSARCAVTFASFSFSSACLVLSSRTYVPTTYACAILMFMCPQF